MSKSKVALACTICHKKNYRVAKSNLERLVLKKFCAACNTHTVHQEEK